MLKIDHLVLTVKDIDKTVNFYTSCLAMEKEIFGDNRVALRFGDTKINLHLFGKEFEPKAVAPTPGSADICFSTTEPISEVTDRLKDLQINIIEGPILRTGACGPISSIYIRDPDNNLIEISNYI